MLKQTQIKQNIEFTPNQDVHPADIIALVCGLDIFLLQMLVKEGMET
jgi:hypothetical protein